MKRRLPALLPALALTLSLSPAALGAEGTTFVDIHPENWFAPYVDACVEAGLMKGVGEGRFDPQGEVTYAQAATLAARIHHIKNGGDGTLPAAPEEYGTVTLEFENGLRLCFPSAECRSTIAPMSRGHLAAPLSEEDMEALMWLGKGEEAPATVSVVLPRPAGPFPCVARRQSGSDGDALVLYPSPDGTQAEREAVNDLVTDLWRVDRRPLPGDWYRDTVYYLELAELGNLSSLPRGTDSPAPRESLVRTLYETAGDLLSPINQITDFADAPTDEEERNIVLAFYNAGVLSGRDEYGTFDSEASLTRAECAAICARILNPELRLEFQLQPLAEEDPAPALPPEARYTLTELRVEWTLGMVEEEFLTFSVWGSDGENQYTLLTKDWSPDIRYVYVNTQMETVSQEFDWAGPIGSDNAGLVGLDGKVYRIQFEP